MVVIERDAYRDEVLSKLNAFKLRYWDHEGINLHSRDIRLAQGPFSILLNAQVRTRFMDGISSLVDSLPFTITQSVARDEPWTPGDLAGALAGLDLYPLDAPY